MNKAQRERMTDTGMAVRYSEHTQDQAYREGAYDFVEGLDMAPRMSALAGYIHHLGLTRVLDVGCGTGQLLSHLDKQVFYAGIDISPTAIAMAQSLHADWKNSSFHTASFRDWTPPETQFDCLVWAGIGRTWTRGGRKGRFEDWLEILSRAETWLAPQAVVILEMVTPHWATLSPLIAGRYEAIAACEIDYGVDDHRALRTTGVFQLRT